MRANDPVQQRLGRLERRIATRFSVRRRELRDWAKVTGLAAGMAAITAMARLVIG